MSEQFKKRKTDFIKKDCFSTDSPRFFLFAASHCEAKLQPTHHLVQQQEEQVSEESSQVSSRIERGNKEKGEIPHTSIDTQAGWSKSGWHGWWYGWKLHLAVSVGSLWIPLAAELTVANTADAEVAPRLVEQMPSKWIMFWEIPITIRQRLAKPAMREAVNW